MTIRRAIELDTIFFLSVSLIAGIVFALNYDHKSNIHTSFSLPVIANFQQTKTKLTPLPILTPIPKVESFSQVSPDGTKILTMTMVTNKDMSKTYKFTTSEGTDTNQHIIYSTTLSAKESMSIPFNTWSPDNVYVFLQHKTSGGTSLAYVMKADGQPFTEGIQYLDVAALFTAKNTGNTYLETTGWASETLLIVNTNREDGSKGPSYWFEVPSKAIIQLSTEF